jgi:hypothetical protein
VPEWNPSGYDVTRGTRWLYAFLSPDERMVKVGLVLTRGRPPGRLREVAKKHPSVMQVAASPLAGVTHQEAERVESAVRHWLAAVYEFEHAGLVDWLILPESPPCDWQALLDSAVEAVLSIDHADLATAFPEGDINPLPDIGWVHR